MSTLHSVPDPLREHKLLLLNLAEFYGQTLSENQLHMYARVIANHAPELIKQAIVEITGDPAIIRFPLPAQILARISPPDTDESKARTAATLIVSAVGRYGWTNLDRAKAYMGELAWKVVELQGGWMQVCQQLNEDNITTFQAQWRELAISTIRRARAGTLSKAPDLPTPIQGVSLAKLLPEMPK